MPSVIELIDFLEDEINRWLQDAGAQIQVPANVNK